MQVGRHRVHPGVVAGLAAAASSNPFGAARAAYNVGKEIYKAMPSTKRKPSSYRSRTRKRVKKTTKAPGGAGSLRQRKPYSRRVAFRRSRRCSTMGRRKLSRKVCSLEKRVRGLTFSENASLGTFTHRIIKPLASAITDAKSQNYGVTSIFGHDMNMFNDSIQHLKYYDPSTPGTLTIADGKTGTYDRRFLFKSVHVSITCRNNYQSDCLLKVYLLTPKQSSSIAPLTAWQSGVTANGDTSLTSYLQIGQYPNDYSDFKDVWNAKLHCKATLSAGQSMTCSHGFKDVEYDPTAFASHSAQYQSKYKNFMFLVVVQGTTGHTSTATGILQAGVDITRYTTRVIQYDAGVNHSYQKVENDLGDMTTGSVQSLKPTADNIPYSST